MPDGHLRYAHIGRLEAGEDDGFSDFIRFHHMRVADIVLGAAVSHGELRLDAAGTDGSDLDAMLAKFSVERLREAHLSKFGGRVDGLAGDPLKACDRRDEEDCSLLLFNHVWDGVAGEEKARLHVGVHQGVVLLD